jgi:hypothetical protein
VSECQRCRSPRVIHVEGKCKDQCTVQYEHKGVTYHGMVLDGLGLGDTNCGDYLVLDYCLECGQIQGTFPVPEKTVLPAFDDEDEDYLYEEGDGVDDPKPRPPESLTATTCYIRGDQHEALQELSRRTGIPMAEYIRQGIALELKKQGFE